MVQKGLFNALITDENCGNASLFRLVGVFVHAVSLAVVIFKEAFCTEIKQWLNMANLFLSQI